MAGIKLGITGQCFSDLLSHLTRDDITLDQDIVGNAMNPRHLPDNVLS